LPKFQEGPVHTHHAIDYLEFTVRDLDQAKRFYAAAFGWAFNDYGPSYSGIQGAEREQGGLTVGDPSPGGPLVVLYSEDLEASLAAVREAGGEVVKEPFGFPGGRRFHFRDPSGNELAVWASAA
jgi:predicted enzyme related to lactoylglutathione lyase